MVRLMVKLFAALVFAAAIPPVVAAPVYRAEPTRVALGEPIALTITARPDKIEALDLAPLQKAFEIRDRSQGGDGRETTLSLTLYPLHTGRIVLPDLGLGMRAPVITVDEESGTVPKVRFRVEAVPNPFHVREAVRLTIEACDDGSLMWQRPQLPTQEGLLHRPLNEEQVEVERGGERCTAHRWHWALQATATGEAMLPLSMLEAGKFGARLRFPPPRVGLNVLPVPNWLPSDAAVGRAEISAAPLPAEWPVNRPLGWRVQVRGAYSVEALQNLLRLQLAGLPQFSHYAPAIEPLADDSGVPRYELNVYAVFGERGKAVFPDLLLPWYDPASGRLQQASLKGASVDVVDPARQRLFVGFGVAAGVLLAGALGYLAWGLFAWRLRRRRALAELKRVTELSALVRQLCRFNLSGKPLPAPTLGEWLQHMQHEMRAPGLAETVAAIEAAHYGLALGELAGLRARAIACLEVARPLGSGFEIFHRRR